MRIQSIQRAIAILELSKKNKQLRLAEITTLIGLPNSTIHTIIKTLEEDNLLIQDKDTKKISTWLFNSRVGYETIYRIGY